MRLDDPEVVRREYATEAGLLARSSVFEGVAGPDAREIAFRAVAEVTPRRVLEVGCGWGAFAKRVADELDADVAAIDISPRMVELARERGVQAQVGDVQDLAFEDGSFDCVVANWMLYHVPDLNRGVSEIARVLRTGGRLVAATNGLRHLAELWSLVGRDRAAEPSRFFVENGESWLRLYFSGVDVRSVESAVAFPDTDAVRRYIAASIAHEHLADLVPELEGPLVATRRSAIFVAEK